MVGKEGDQKSTENKGRDFPLGLLASAVAPFLSEIAKPILKKVFGGRKRRRSENFFYLNDELSH